MISNLNTENYYRSEFWRKIRCSNIRKAGEQSDCGVSPFREAAAIGAILIMVHLMISFFLKNDLLLRTTLSDILIPIVDVLATISLFSLASNPELEPRIRKAWTFMAIGLLSNTLADTSWTILEIGLHQELFPSIADVFYLAFYPIFALGIFLLPATPLSGWEKSKTVLDMAIISITAVLLYWLFLIGPLMEAGGESSTCPYYLCCLPNHGSIACFCSCISHIQKTLNQRR